MGNSLQKQIDQQETDIRRLACGRRNNRDAEIAIHERKIKSLKKQQKHHPHRRKQAQQGRAAAKETASYKREHEIRASLRRENRKINEQNKKRYHEIVDEFDRFLNNELSQHHADGYSNAFLDECKAHETRIDQNARRNFLKLTVGDMEDLAADQRCLLQKGRNEIYQIEVCNQVTVNEWNPLFRRMQAVGHGDYFGPWKTQIDHCERTLDMLADTTVRHTRPLSQFDEMVTFVRQTMANVLVPAVEKCEMLQLVNHKMRKVKLLVQEHQLRPDGGLEGAGGTYHHILENFEIVYGKLPDLSLMLLQQCCNEMHHDLDRLSLMLSSWLLEHDRS